MEPERVDPEGDFWRSALVRNGAVAGPAGT